MSTRLEIETFFPSSPSSNVQGTSGDAMDFTGRYITFSTPATTLVSGDTNNNIDVFLRDIKDGTTQIISKRNSTTQTNNISMQPSLSLDGRDALFMSWDAGLVSGDTNGIPDIFVSKTGI